MAVGILPITDRRYNQLGVVGDTRKSLVFTPSLHPSCNFSFFLFREPGTCGALKYHISHRKFTAVFFWQSHYFSFYIIIVVCHFYIYLK